MTETDLGGRSLADKTPIRIPTDATAEIIAEVAGRYGLDYRGMTGRRNTAAFCVIRHLAYAEVRRRRPHLSFPQIGQAFGGRDHSTILLGIQRHEARMAWVDVLRAAARIDGQRDLFR